MVSIQNLKCRPQARSLREIAWDWRDRLLPQSGLVAAIVGIRDPCLMSQANEGSCMWSRLTLLIVFLISPINPADISSQAQERRVPIAILSFGDSGIGRLASETLAANLESVPELLVLDRDQASTAAKGAGHLASLNMSLQEARGLGAAIGSDYYIVGDAQTLRRSPSVGPLYFESYASIFLVSSRTGRLLIWQRPSFRAATAVAAEKLLLADLSSGATRSRIPRCHSTSAEGRADETRNRD